MMKKLSHNFNSHGLLPVGDYALTLPQLRGSMLVNGPDGRPSSWDAGWRGKLVDNLEILIRQLWKVGIKNIFINGSFVEEKDHPNDIDGYFECDLHELASGKLQRELNLIDPHKVWIWDTRSRIFDSDSGKKQLPMWLVYRIELYPHHNQSSGISDKFGNEMLFPSAFRQSRREYREKGIVRIIEN